MIHIELTILEFEDDIYGPISIFEHRRSEIEFLQHNLRLWFNPYKSYDSKTRELRI